MHLDPLLPRIVAAAFGILLLGLLGRRLRQPHVVTYLLAGVVLGPSGLGVFTEEQAIARLGDFGVVVLLFFVGMEVDLPRLAASWRLPVAGTALQIAASLGCVWLLGEWLDWPVGRIVLFGFAISLSSTALVVSMMRAWGELDTQAGRDALGVLLVQDFAVVPMVVVLGLLAGERPSYGHLALQIAGAAAVVGLLVLLLRGPRLRLPIVERLREDHELQVFAAFAICFGMAWGSALVGLSSALGSFVAGLVLSSSKETGWVHERLDSFRVLLVALFFVSVGMLIDLEFLTEHWGAPLALIGIALGLNTLINAGVLRWLGRDWGTSLYVGALLSQVGEFSFVLASVGREAGIIGNYAYQGTILVVAGTLVLTPLWIAAVRPFRGSAAREAA